MSFGHFVKDIMILTEKLANQGFFSSKLREKLVIFRDYYFFKWAKYGVDISSCINKLFGIHSNWF